ncbi:hypothetical protein BCV70DRAFT_201004 [Testicularia cyperi]|uniref:Uncharacterized protein n=1 Tax=Testicularia cyperi TaxID=1882483 RepID=A0A317XMA2_9BASI|nr:hypothetical protein BCV70DRAFT_201004 [Testicularia cyperi]
MDPDGDAENPWGAAPSYSDRQSAYRSEQSQQYESQLNDIIGDSENGTIEVRAHPAPSADDIRQEQSVYGDSASSPPHKRSEPLLRQDSDDEEEFVYEGVDADTSIIQRELDDEDNDASNTEMDADAYNAQMRDILGSDADASSSTHNVSDDGAPDVAIQPELHGSPELSSRGVEAEAEVASDRRSSTTAKDPTHRGQVPPSDDGSSFHYPGPVPQDISFSVDAKTGGPGLSRRAPSSSSSSRLFTPRSTSGTGFSSFRYAGMGDASTVATPQRPAAYPSLSRLRASVGKAAGSSSSLALPRYLQAIDSRASSSAFPGSPSSSSSRAKPRSPLPFEFTLQGQAQTSGPAAADEPSSSSSRVGRIVSPPQRSRQSSISLSVSGSVSSRTNARRRPRVSFPYGPTGNRIPSGPSSLSLLSDPASMAHATAADSRHNRKTSEAVASTQYLPETSINSRGELSRDFVKWSALRRIVANVNTSTSSGQSDSASAREVHPTVLAVAGGLVAIGSRGGRTVVSDFSQEPIASCGHDGQGDGDAVTALAFSSDHTFLGVGHASGHVFLYDLNNPSRAARHVPPVPLSSVKAGRKEGHLSGSAIVHIGFVGLRHTAIVTADNKGLAFYHALGKILGVSSNDTLRLLGKYPQYEHEDELGLASGRKRSAIYQLSPLPLGPRPHQADDTNFIAMITPTKMVLVGLKPSARTWYRKVNSEGANESAGFDEKQPRPPISVELTSSSITQDPPQEQEQQIQRQGTLPSAGCLAWFPASTETDGKRTRQTNPILAFSFGRHLHLLRLLVRKIERPDPNQSVRGATSSKQVNTIVEEEIDVVELTGKQGIEEPAGIVGLQWFSPDLLLLVTRSGLALFDCRAGKVTERMDGGSASAVLSRTVEQRWYDSVLFQDAAPQDTPVDHVESASKPLQPSRAWTVNHSVKVSKGRAFFLTGSDLVVGTLMSWADRLLQYVSRGDFLSAIELATTFYQSQALGSAVGLPSDAAERTRIVAEKVRDLMIASAEYAFAPERLTDSTHVTPDGRGVDRTELFEGLARVCAKACLALDDLNFLFDRLYDKYEDNGIESIFVGQMEAFIMSGELRTLPIPVVQRLVAFRRDRSEYDLAEQIIWHVDPRSLDLDQALSLCLDQRLYDALIYVYNSALEDYVSPIVELLQPLRRVLRVRRRALAQQHSPQMANGHDFANEISIVVANDKTRYTHLREAEGGADSAFSAAYEHDEEETSHVETETHDFYDAYKIFSYLSVILVGHQYPSQEPIAEERLSNKVKSTIYPFLFSGGSMIWPPGPGGKLVLFGLEDDSMDTDGNIGSNGPVTASSAVGTDEHGTDEPIYPYLRLLLEFDAEAFLDALDLAFEDPFLDDEEVVGKRISRQLIVGILLELARPARSPSTHFNNSDEPPMSTSNGNTTSMELRASSLPLMARTFIQIFVARNAPKYPQFIRLSQPEVDYLLRALALPLPKDASGYSNPKDTIAFEEATAIESTREDRELAVEFLLSHYKPRFDEQWLDIFEQAAFGRILRSAFRQEKKWDRLMALYLRDYLAVPDGLQALANDSRLQNAGVEMEATSSTSRNRSQEAFSHIEETLFNASRLPSKAQAELGIKLHEQLTESIVDLLDLDPLRTASLLDRFFPERHAAVLQRLSQLDEKRMLLFLRCFFEPLQVSKDLATASHAQTTVAVQDDRRNRDANKSRAVDANTYNAEVGRADPSHFDQAERELYLDLLCRYEPEAVVQNLDSRHAHFFDLEKLLRACRQGHAASNGARVARNSDAILWSLDRLGRPQEAFEELDRLVDDTADSIALIVESQAGSSSLQMQSTSGHGHTEGTIAELVSDVRRAVNVAVRLCIERANAFEGVHDSEDEEDESRHRSGMAALKQSRASAADKMDTDEVWFRLLRSLVQLVHNVAQFKPSTSEAEYSSESNHSSPQPVSSLLDGVRDIVQDTLSSLISSTAAEAVSFPALFRRLTGEEIGRKDAAESFDLSENTPSSRANGTASINGKHRSEGSRGKHHSNGAATYYAEIRSVLDGMLSAYHLRAELLGITNKLFDRDTYNQFRKLNVQRKRGWRPAGGAATRCASCGLILIGSRRGTLGKDTGNVASTANGDVSQASHETNPADSRRRMSHDVSTSSMDSASESLRRRALLQPRMPSTPSAALLSPALQYRRAKSPYDDKAAPLASPRIDKGKGVVRSSSVSSSSGPNGGSHDYFDGIGGRERDGGDEPDGYFSPRLSYDAGYTDMQRGSGSSMGGSHAMARTPSSASGNGFSLRINDAPARQREEEKSMPHEDRDQIQDGDASETGSTGTLTPLRSRSQSQSRSAVRSRQASMSSSVSSMTSFAGLASHRLERLAQPEPDSKHDEKIVVQRSGLAYHESCFLQHQRDGTDASGSERVPVRMHS